MNTIRATLAAFAAALLFAFPTAHGAVILSGATIPLPGNEGSISGSPGGGTTLNIGSDDTGALIVDDDSDLESHAALIGIGAVGTATVSGAGSTWTNFDEVKLGLVGSGALRVEAGAVFTLVGIADIGANIGSTGNAVVTGVDSLWTIDSKAASRGIRVGRFGDGTLRIEDGGAVEGHIAVISFASGSTGSAIVTGTGSAWSNTNDLVVGYGGDGTLLVDSGAVASNYVGIVGQSAGSTGEVTISGLGSTWDNAGGVVVGDSGQGTLSIENGAVVNSFSGDIGTRAGSKGLATVTGDGSAWATTQVMHVGFAGAGTFNILDAGSVEIGNALTLAARAGSSGVVSLDGGTLDLTGHDIDFGAGDAQFNFTTGMLRDVNTFGSSLDQQGGTLVVGGSPDVMTVEGDYSAAQGAVLQIELFGDGGIAGVDFDRLVVSGDASLAGTVDVLLDSAFTPSVGDYWDVLLADDITINQSTFAVASPSGHEISSLLVQFAGGGVALRLSIVPEPSAIFLLTTVLTCIMLTAATRTGRHCGQPCGSRKPWPGSAAARPPDVV